MSSRTHPEGFRVGAVFLLALGLCGVLWLGATRLDPGSAAFASPGDHHMYSYMAERGVFGFRVAPYSWRPLVPALAGLFPEPQKGFIALSFSGLAVTGAAMYMVARRLRFSVFMSVLGVVLLFGLSRAVKFNLHDYWLTEPIAYAFGTGALVALLSRRDGLFALLLCCGVLAKESVLIVAPLGYTLRASRLWDGRAAMRAAIMVLPAVLVVVVLRVALPAANGDVGYVDTLPPPIADQTRAGALQFSGFGDLIQRTVGYRSRHLGETVRGTLLAFGITLPLLASLGWRRSWRLALRLSPLVVLSLAQLLIARNTDRLVVAAFPVVVVLALFGADGLVRRGIVSERHLLLLAGGLFLANLIEPDRWMVPIPVELAIVAGTVAVALASRLGREAGR